MAVIRVPFCADAELCPASILSETFSNPGAMKSVLFDTRRLRVTAKPHAPGAPEGVPAETRICYVVGSIPYICTAYPADAADSPLARRRAAAVSANDDADPVPSDALGWIYAAGCAQVDARIGVCATGDMPGIEGISVEELSVSGVLAAVHHPNSPTDSGGDGQQYAAKWHGCFVITTG